MWSRQAEHWNPEHVQVEPSQPLHCNQLALYKKQASTLLIKHWNCGPNWLFNMPPASDGEVPQQTRGEIFFEPALIDPWFLNQLEHRSNTFPFLDLTWSNGVENWSSHDADSLPTETSSGKRTCEKQVAAKKIVMSTTQWFSAFPLSASPISGASALGFVHQQIASSESLAFGRLFELSIPSRAKDYRCKESGSEKLPELIAGEVGLLQKRTKHFESEISLTGA